MKKEIKEFRCIIDNTLFCKCSIESICEAKCRKCKNFNYFIQGTTIIKDTNNYFKGED